MDNQNSTAKKILIADDNTAIIDALRYIFEDAGYLVEATAEGETVRKMAKHRPDLLILDVKMSGVDGRQICKSIKSQDETRNIPIIMFSANKEAESSSRQAGADCFLPKPFEMRDLLKEVENHIN